MRQLIDILYPKHCPICMDIVTGDRLICDPCRKKLKTVGQPACFKCGKPLGDEWKEYCSDCEKRMPAFEQGIVWAEYSSFYIRRMLAQVKYHEDPQLLDFPCLDFAEKKKRQVKDWEAEALIPVPVHLSRLKVRGYNQAAEIADRLSEVWKIPVDEGYLKRTRKTEAQKKLGAEERLKNLQNVFEVTGQRGKYRTVILIDDIYTTGSTMEACTRALKRAGVERVYTAVLASGRDRG